MQERKIFDAALVLTNLEAQDDYVRRACGDNSAMREHLLGMLQAQRKLGSFLEADPVAAGLNQTAVHTSQIQHPGETIGGRYKLLEAIGEGGMGSVWLAEQKEPVKRKVAVKLIKPGMDSRQVLARFEAERQALALMDHPNIAKVFDGGMTAEGRPFFVMEFVKGVPLTEYCDNARLTLKERLQLFTPVCQAVQHAHQKGIIHRDLKPSNILICLYDGKPVPKVIDFGLAKAMHQSLTEQSLHTAFGMMVGTPLYMSPEQAEHNNLDVDTRTDIYSLGVILYELLTGSTPLERQLLKQAAYNEILRLIKEVEPPKPSTRLSGSVSLPSVAAQRNIEPKKLSKSLAGDLDWIVMKALDKERSRRYETANGLARDIERFLDDEAVEACPPTTVYRLKKFIHRNRLQVIAASLVLLALVLGIVGTSVGLYQANQARVAENRQRKLAEAKEQEALAAAEGERKAKVREAERAEGERQAKLDAEAKKTEAERARVRAETEKKRADEEKKVAKAVKDFLQTKLLAQADTMSQADILLRTGGLAAEAKFNPTIRELLDRAAKELAPDKIEANFPNQPLVQAEILHTVGIAYWGVGEAATAVPFMVRSLDLYKAKLGPNHFDTLGGMNDLAVIYEADEQLDKALPLYEESHKLRKAKHGPDHRDTIHAMNNLAGCYTKAKKLELALPLLEETLTLRKAKLGPNDPDTLKSMNFLAGGYQAADQHDKALPLFEETLTLRKARLGPDHPDTLISMGNLAGCYLHFDKLDLALPLLEETLKLVKAKRGPDHPNTFISMENLANGYQKAGQWDKALPLLEETLTLRKVKHGPDHPNTLRSMESLAEGYQKAGQGEKALPLREESLKLTKTKHGTDHPDTLLSMFNLAKGYKAANQFEKALPLLEETFKLNKAKHGPDHTITLVSMGTLASAYRQAGRLEKALLLSEEAFKLVKATHGPDHSNTLASMNDLALAYGSLNQWDKSLPLYEELLPLKEKKSGRMHPETLLTMANMGSNYMAVGRMKEAIPLLEEVYRASQKFPTLRSVGTDLLYAYAKAGKPAEASKLIDEFLADARKTLPKGSPPLAGQLSACGMCLLEMKGYTKAEPLLRESLTIREKTQPDAWTTFNTQSMLGGALLGQKKYADAEPLLLDGYKGMKDREAAIPPQGKVRLPEAIERLVQLYTDWHAAEPDKGYDAKAAERQKELDEHNAALAAEKPATTPDK